MTPRERACKAVKCSGITPEGWRGHIPICDYVTRAIEEAEADCAKRLREERRGETKMSEWPKSWPEQFTIDFKQARERLDADLLERWKRVECEKAHSEQHMRDVEEAYERGKKDGERESWARDFEGQKGTNNPHARAHETLGVDRCSGGAGVRHSIICRRIGGIVEEAYERGKKDGYLDAIREEAKDEAEKSGRGVRVQDRGDDQRDQDTDR